MEPTRYCFVTNKNSWYLIEVDKKELFDNLLIINDTERLSDEFDDCQIDAVEDYSFEFPLFNNYYEE